MTWIRVDANRHSHHLGRAIGGWGGIVLEAIWEIIKVHGRRGEVTLHAVTPEAICEWLRLDREDGGPWTPFVEIGLERCFDKGAISENKGKVSIKNWYQYQEDPTNAERQARFREKKTSNGSNALHNGITDSNGNNDDGTGQDSTGQRENSSTTSIQQIEFKWKVWNRFVAKFQDYRGGRFPGHSQGSKQADNLKAIEDTYKLTTWCLDRTDDELIRLVDHTLDDFFTNPSDFKDKAEYSLGTYRNELPKLLKRAKP